MYLFVSGGKGLKINKLSGEEGSRGRAGRPALWRVLVVVALVALIWRAGSLVAADNQSTTESAANQPTAAATQTSPSQPVKPQFQLEFLRQSDPHSWQESTRNATISTTLPVTLRITSPDGKPARDLPVVPLIVSEPDNVSDHMFVHPPQLRTNEVGELRFDLHIGDKPGKYQVLMFRGANDGLQTVITRFDVLAQEPNWPTFLILYLGGGLAIFLYGLKLASDGLIEYTGNRMRTALADITRNRFLGFLAGIGITFFTQSSGATTLILMSFLRARLLSFSKAFGVVLGAAVGGTFTVYLISFDLSKYALPAIAFGCFTFLFGKRPRIKAVGLSLFGFGMVFLGMRIMTDQVLTLKSFPFFRDAISALRDYPVWTVLLSAIFTALAQSSGATMGVVLALGRQDLITLPEAVPFFFGASIGICFPALTGMIGAPPEAKRLAWGHLLYKICGAVLFLPLIGVLAHVGGSITASLPGHSHISSGDLMARSIANTYIIYIASTAAVALFLVTPIENLLRRFIPEEPEQVNGEIRAKYLDLQILDTPPVALGSALREISRMGRFIEEMMKEILTGLLAKDKMALEFVRQRDNKVDYLNREITRFLTHLTQKAGSDAESIEKATELLFIVSDLEAIGDIFDKNLIPNAQKMIVHDYEFSDEGKADLKYLHQKVSERLSQMVIALATSDPKLVDPVITGFQTIQDEGRRLHLRHLQRLRGDKMNSLESSSVHLDVLNYLLRIDYLIFDIALHLAGKVKEPALSETSH
ncbi:MAG: Na/Pi cotransporter family protein [Candidatus Sumerlaeaceae bacterium]|nr:Na/Pi cotransporter family protein [Candidatus Sumerlaeaceae bacterium]